MTYTIYADKVEEVVKKLNRISKKAGKYGIPFSYSVSEEHPKKVNYYETEGCTAYKTNTVVVSAVDVSIECDTLIYANGWKVVAHIEHGSQGNIVTAINCDPEPEWYNLPSRCDHCGTNRRRNTTFIVEHENGTRKQVGKTCLKDYTGIDPATALMAEEIRDIILNESVRWETCGTAPKMYETAYVIALAVESVKEHGYIKSTEQNATKIDVLERFKHDEHPSTDSIKTAENIVAWLSSLDDSVVGPERDCKSLALSGYCKLSHIGRLAYMPLAYNRYMEEIERKKAQEARKTAEKVSEYVGTEGERIALVAQSAALLTSWENQYGYTYLYKFVSDDNVFVWFASRPVEVCDGMTIKGTIKSHNERDGIKQTILTRCKAV